MTLNEERLNELSYLEYLNWMQDHIKYISYSKDSNSAYHEAKEIIRNFIKRYIKEFGLTTNDYDNTEIGRSLRTTQLDLDDYHKYASTYKAKAEVISHFKSDMESDISRLIFDITNKTS